MHFLPYRRLNFTTLSFFVSLSFHPFTYLPLTPPPTSSPHLCVADQQQDEADWEGVQSEAHQVCPGNQFLRLPFILPSFILYSLLLTPLCNTVTQSFLDTQWAVVAFDLTQKACELLPIPNKSVHARRTEVDPLIFVLSAANVVHFSTCRPFFAIWIQA